MQAPKPLKRNKVYVKKGGFRDIMDHTKHFLAKSLVELMKQTPLDKISVTDITDNCGLNRHTFYYHFKDKQDLICWIFDWDITHKLKVPPLSDITMNKNAFFVRVIMEFMYENKLFYINALNSEAQNCLQNHLFDYIRAFREVQIEAILNGRLLDPVGKSFLADYFTSAICGLIVRWSKDGMKNHSMVFYSDFMNVAYRSMQFLIEGYFTEHTEDLDAIPAFVKMDAVKDPGH